LIRVLAGGRHLIAERLAPTAQRAGPVGSRSCWARGRPQRLEPRVAARSLRRLSSPSSAWR
jgi:hypothetical protein